jgi:hypothetical protein
MNQLASWSTKVDATLTQPGSLAATYAEYKAQTSRAAVTMGTHLSPETVRQIPGGWLLFDPGRLYLQWLRVLCCRPDRDAVSQRPAASWPAGAWRRCQRGRRNAVSRHLV